MLPFTRFRNAVRAAAPITGLVAALTSAPVFAKELGVVHPVQHPSSVIPSAYAVYIDPDLEAGVEKSYSPRNSDRTAWRIDRG